VDGDLPALKEAPGFMGQYPIATARVEVLVAPHGTCNKGP
jgi:hypothetical protein